MTPIEAALQEIKQSVGGVWARLNQVSNASGEVRTKGGVIRVKGSGTISVGTSVAVTHSAGVTPLIQDIFVTPSSSPATPLYVTAIGSTTFTVNGPNGTTFGWTVILA